MDWQAVSRIGGLILRGVIWLGCLFFALDTTESAPTRVVAAVFVVGLSLSSRVGGTFDQSANWRREDEYLRRRTLELLESINARVSKP